jgi:anti-anti-sigma factor
MADVPIDRPDSGRPDTDGPDNNGRATRLCAEKLLVAHSHVNGAHTTYLLGELDLGSAADVLDAMRPVVCESSELVLDLSGLTFMDSAGLHLILRLRDLCRRFSCRMSITSANGQVRRLLELTGVIVSWGELDLVVE